MSRGRPIGAWLGLPGVGWASSGPSRGGAGSAPSADASSPVVPTKIGRALAPRLGLARDEEVKVSRVQCEVTPLGADGATLRVTSLGANPTPWFPAAHAHARRLIRKGEEATLRLGDGLGLFQDERAPGSMRVVAALTAAAAPSAAALATNPAAVVDLTRDGDDDAPLLPRDDAPAKTRDAAAAADPATALAKNPASPPAVRAAAAPLVVALLVGPPGAGKSTSRGPAALHTVYFCAPILRRSR